MIHVLLLTAVVFAANDPAQRRFDAEVKDLATELAKVNLKPLSPDEYDARRSALRQQAHQPNDPHFVLEKLQESRIKEYPPKWSRSTKSTVYAQEVKLLEQARDFRAHAESKAASVKSVDQSKESQNK